MSLKDTLKVLLTRYGEEIAFCGKAEYAVAWFGLVVASLCSLTLVSLLLFTGNEIMALIFLVPTCYILSPLFKARRRG